MKQKNEGFSLVELIVVIAIMTILTGLISAGIGMAVSKPADECIDKLKASLQSIRVTSMGKFDAHIEIYKKGDQIYAKEYYTEDSSGKETTKENIVGFKGVQVFYEINNSGSYTELVDGGTPIIIYYDRSSGAFSNASTGYYCTKIKAVKNSRTAEMILYPLTGKIEIR